MTTGDLTERIRDEITGHPIGSGYYQTAVGTDEAADIAADILPIVEAEVRAAKAEALREAADAWHAEHEGTRPGPYGWMWDRATKYETGASDEHR